MVVFGNHKYACLSCIRGHRSSSCEHHDRILLQIRKPGRKPQAEPQSRFALIKKEGQENDFELIKVPSEEEKTNDKDEVVVTEKYIFVHVGDNLFRRELRPEFTSSNNNKPQEKRLVEDELEENSGTKKHKVENAPLVIGPMQYQQNFINKQENILSELGMTDEEVSTLWPENLTNFSFASQCVLPGQCQCGDGCECPDCYEHRH